MHGIVTDRLDRNRSVILSDYFVTYGCMNDLQAAAHYLQNLLPDMVAEFEPRPSSKARFLPHSLNSMFRLAEIDLLGLRVLLAKVPTQAEPTPPSRLIAQVHLLAEKAGLRVVLVLSGVSPYTRSRLIESRVDFVVPGSQLFAPSFLMSLRERDSSPPVPLSVGKHRSHPAQAVLIAALLRPDFEERGIPGSVPWVPLELAREAGYSRMTASRVARELVAANLVSARRKGRETSLRFLQTRRSLWEAALRRLRSPVLRTTGIGKGGLAMLPADDCRAAGETGLSVFTELAAPARPVAAIPRDYFRGHPEPEWFPVAGEGYADVQHWAYSTRLGGAGAAVDRLSLYLSLQGQGDPRLDGALRDLLDEVFA
ncbi:hypothetical protein DP16_3980 [Stenotrophomonas maltophilia]|nr:hypothetical protein DP16_3980 [Stenotrophomonas maltophilia]SNW14620.1 Uncharacterised protein [Stenotrophomonas maltophilia]